MIKYIGSDIIKRFTADSKRLKDFGVSMLDYSIAEGTFSDDVKFILIVRDLGDTFIETNVLIPSMEKQYTDVSKYRFMSPYELALFDTKLTCQQFIDKITK